MLGVYGKQFLVEARTVVFVYQCSRGGGNIDIYVLFQHHLERLQIAISDLNALNPLCRRLLIDRMPRSAGAALFRSSVHAAW